MSVEVVDAERAMLDRLREEYEIKGYEFVTQPRADLIPRFLKDHRPDALALSADDKVVIEVKKSRTRASAVLLSYLAQLVSAEPGWRLVVIYSGEDSDDSAKMSRAARPQIDQVLQEATSLEQAGHYRLALIAGWSLMEALARQLYDERDLASSKPFSPLQVIQRLAMDGYLVSEDAKRLRGLISLRNSAIHGDFSVDIASEDVRFILSRIRAINSALSV